MPNWTLSMQQTFEFYIVDPATWKDSKLIDNVKACTINRDLSADTLGSASFDIVDSVGEAYIRVYLITVQNGIREKFPLGTFLVQTPSSSFDGKSRKVTMDAYTPLLELKESPPPLGYSIPKNSSIMSIASELTEEHLRAPVVKTESSDLLYYDFVANTNDNWLTFLSDLIANAKYSYDLDEMGRVLFSPKRDTASLQPVWTYNDDNCSILYSDVTLNHDLYGIPNVVEVIYTNGGNDQFISEDNYVRVVNDNPNSPTSTVNRGREIVHRITDPKLIGKPDAAMLKEYADQALRDLSTLEYTITYTHGYCPARLGDCVRFNYTRAGLSNIKARVISQTIKCDSGCSVQEKAIFTTNLWG